LKSKLLIIIIILTLGIFSAIVAILTGQELPQVDMVALNELRVEVENNAADFLSLGIEDFEIVIINFDGEILYSSHLIQAKAYEHWLNWAIQNDKIILEFSGGRIFVTRPADSSIAITITLIAVLTALIIAIYILHSIYYHRTIYKPFKNLKTFAIEFANGNLDSPLLMDKNNIFGAFSESFDILRTELKTAKEKEAALERSKKELIAQLSHDIRTPLSSIKAVIELLLLDKECIKLTDKLPVVLSKANEIDSLVANMFSVALEDLSELKVASVDMSSKDIKNLIVCADYLGKIKSFNLPDCLIYADQLRLRQIFGNIINNSYKYAKTSIVVSSELADNFLAIEFADAGKGVKDDELPFIMGKFYRGEGNEGEAGAGLGLYICSNLLEKMGGAIDCYNTGNGFAVKIFLLLA